MFERRQLAEKAGGFAHGAHVPALPAGVEPAPLSRASKEQARALLEGLAKARRQPPGLRLFLAQGFAALKEFDRAMEQLERVRRADPDNWEALALEARIHFQARRYEQAVDRAVESLSLIYFQPALHHLLGLALQRLGEKEKAEQAYRAALAQAPEFPAALEALGRLISQDRARIGEGSLYMARAAEFRRRAKERAARGAGLPASRAPPAGGGLPALRPQRRRPARRPRAAGDGGGGTAAQRHLHGDADAGRRGPAGLHRRTPPAGRGQPARLLRARAGHEAAPGCFVDSQARGKAVKIVAHLLPFLPKGEQYRLIFMHREHAGGGRLAEGHAGAAGPQGRRPCRRAV